MSNSKRKDATVTLTKNKKSPRLDVVGLIKEVLDEMDAGVPQVVSYGDDYIKQEVIFDQYSIGDIVGTSGFGVVRHVQDTKNKREYALKAARGPGSDAVLNRERTYLEATRGKKNIAQLLPQLTIEQNHILLEYYPHKFHEFFSGHLEKSVISSRVFRYLQQMTTALTALEELHIVHRDLKPGNIMFDGKNLQLIDFGIACDEGDAMIECAGTYAFMSPDYIHYDTTRPHPRNNFVGPVFSSKYDMFPMGLIGLLVMDNYARNSGWDGTSEDLVDPTILHRKMNPPSDLETYMVTQASQVVSVRQTFLEQVQKRRSILRGSLFKFPRHLVQLMEYASEPEVAQRPTPSEFSRELMNYERHLL